MSTFKVPVVSYTLEKHPDSDHLSIAKIKGYTCVVKSSDFSEQDKLGVYIPIDAVASKDHPLLSFLEGKKIKARRLRGVFSQGVLLPLQKVVEAYELTGAKSPVEGDDLAEILGIKKWEPPIEGSATMVKSAGGADQVSRPDWLSKYTDIENYLSYPDIIQEGEEVEVSLKLHGTSAVFALVDGKPYICSRNRCLRLEELTVIKPKFKNKLLNKILSKLGLENHPAFSTTTVLPPPDSTWHRVYKNFDLNRILFQLSYLNAKDKTDLPNVAIYGEIVGVQDLMYGLNSGELDFYVYDIRVQAADTQPSDGYLNPKETRSICELLRLKVVPALYTGPFHPAVLEERNGKDPIGKTHVREGVVIKPLTSRYYDRKLGRVILKRIGEDYLLRKNATDF